MKIQVGKDSTSGKVRVPKGDYWVSLKSESGEIILSAGGKDLRLPAKKRKTKVNSKTTQISFYSGGGNTWSLVIIAPKSGEWVAFLELEKK